MSDVRLLPSELCCRWSALQKIPKVTLTLMAICPHERLTLFPGWLFWLPADCSGAVETMCPPGQAWENEQELGRARVSKRARMPRCGMESTCGAMHTRPAGSALPCLIRLLCAEWTCDAPLGMDDAKVATMIGARHGHTKAMQENNTKSGKLQEAKRVSKRWLLRPRERMPRCGMGCLFDPRPVSPLPPCLGALLCNNSNHC